MINRIILTSVFFLTVLLSCKKKDVKDPIPYWIKNVSCDFETYIKKNDVFEFETDSNQIIITGSLNQDVYRSGSSSLVIPKQNEQPLISLKELEPGQLVEFTIWQSKHDTNAIVSAILHFKNGKSKKIESNYNSTVKTEKGWKQHFISIPIQYPIDHLDIVLRTINQSASFDDLNIKIYPKQPKNNISETLRIYIPNKSKNKLNTYISKALPYRIIPESSKKYIDAYYLTEEDTFEIKMKIKGDWNDHITPKKASFRFKLSGATYKGMTNFSIQHPKTRNFISEWFMHKMAEKEDVLCTKYSFINVVINDYNYGVYALEEHFEKHILENRNRREAPILKFDETGNWKVREEEYHNNFRHNIPYFESSITKPFKYNRTLKNNILRAQFIEGTNLMELFKQGHLEIEDIFDIDELAKFYALVEFSGSYHSLYWHNRRLYFNPITQKLEHIYFDALPQLGDSSNVMFDILNNREKEGTLIFDIPIVMNKKFKDRFFHHLTHITSPLYLDSLLTYLDSSINTYYTAISAETPEYIFDKKIVYDKAKQIRKNMTPLEEFWDEQLDEAKNIDFWMRKESYKKLRKKLLFEDVALNAFSSINQNGKYNLELENYHLNQISIIAVNYAKGGVKYNFKTPIKLSSFAKGLDKKIIELDSMPYELFFTTKNTGEKVHKSKPIPWKKPTGETTRNSLNDEFRTTHQCYTLEEDNWIVFNKKCEIDQLIYIPEQYKVKILPGSNIIFKENGGIIVNNQFICKGSLTDSIKIKSISSNSQGITIIKGSKAIIDYVTIDGLSNLNFHNWILTGALTIYETPISISNLIIVNNHSEDALNIIRSPFIIDRLKIKNTKSDGFDADFCTGTITNSSFSNTGNDCIDFSGSQVNITNINIINSGDKGISGGEKSILKLNNITIDGAIIGIASKDATLITGNNITIKNSTTGAASFQKKITYGIANCNLNNVIFDNCSQIHLIENGSSITINSTILEGTKTINVDSLYYIQENDI